MFKDRKPIILIAAICVFIALGAGFGFRYLSVEHYKSNRLAEKSTVLAVVDAFFSTYATLRSTEKDSTLPVPATFRAHALEAFNESRKGDDSISLNMVGFPGREIRIAATDDHMREMMRGFARDSAPVAVVSLLDLNGETVLRTIRPSIAKRESCVSCHNQVRAGECSMEDRRCHGRLCCRGARRACHPEYPGAEYLSGFAGPVSHNGAGVVCLLSPCPPIRDFGTGNRVPPSWSGH
ncbi:MAG: c-type heme family protein [Verrucomicrobiia bacterium]|jgi:hypothetical protein